MQAQMEARAQKRKAARPAAAPGGGTWKDYNAKRKQQVCGGGGSSARISICDNNLRTHRPAHTPNRNRNWPIAKQASSRMKIE